MSIPYTCPNCQFQGKAADELSGQQGRCPKCKQSFQIEPTDWIEQEAIEHQEAAHAITEMRQVTAQHQFPGDGMDDVLKALNENARRRDKALASIVQHLEVIRFRIGWFFVFFIFTVAVALLNILSGN